MNQLNQLTKVIRRNFGVAGEYIIRKYSKKRGTSETIGPFKNIITDIGLDMLGQGGIGNGYCYVGTGTGTPAATDTNLFTYLATSLLGIIGSNSYAGPPSYRIRHSRNFSFGEGVAAGNLSEIGIGRGISSANNVFSHALIVDSEGDPTVITVLPDEYLDVVFLFDLYPPLDDVIASGVTISGSTYDLIKRASGVGGWNPNTLLGSGFSVGQGNAYAGVIGAITAGPSGTVSGTVDTSTSAYSPGSYYRNLNYRFGLAQGNVGGVRSIRWYLAGNNNSFQTQFTPAIPKTSSDILTLVFRVSWSRYTP